MSISRREFVKAAAGGVAVVAIPSILTGCAGVRRHSLLEFYEQQTLQEYDMDLENTNMLYHASLAPSGHNTQPWKVRIVDSHQWVILSDQTRWLPAVDPQQRETLLSIGAFIENLSVAAISHGYGIDMEVLADASNDTEVARVTLNKQNTKTNFLKSIVSRRTVRKDFLSKDLSSQDVHTITEGDVYRFRYFSFGSQESTYLNEGTIEANRIQISRDDAQRELANWIRWSNGAAKEHRDGLTPEGMDITGFAGWYVRHFYDQKDVMSEGFRKKTIDGVIKQVEKHGGWLVLTSKADDVSSLLETGRCFQRMFLKVRDRMIAVHPMSQMLEESPFKNQVTQELGLDSPVQFILRIGYVENYPDPVTLRRPVSWFVEA